VEGRTNHAIDPDVSIRRILEMLGAVPAGHVAVYEPGDATCAHFGELSATSLQVHGVAGVVINGGCRDVDLVLESGLPVFARYRTPQDAVSRWEVLEWGHAIDIEGVSVAAGDYIVGDADGVAVIPRDLIETVLAEAEALVGTENLIRDAVRGGMKPLAAYEQFGKF
jgi:regulator of RNase E activity RraA